jgi:hypothetical protein
MLHIRVVKTKCNSRSVQVYRHQNSKQFIIKHLGSGTTDEEIKYLKSGDSNMVLNEKLIEKTKKLLGIIICLII